MKKVLFVATVDVHIKAFHIPYLKLLHDNGYEVHVATNGDENFPFCDVKHQICVERSPFKISNIKAIKQLKKIIDKEKFDIVHCHTPMGSVVTRLATRKSNRNGAVSAPRVIYTCHGFHFYKGAALLNWLVFYPIEWYLAKYTDTLITINTEDYELAKKKFSKRCKDIKYIPGIGVDFAKYNINVEDDKKNEFLKSLNIPSDAFVIIYPARLCKDKNQILLLELMKKLKDENVYLLLPGNDEMNGFFDKYIKENDLSKVFLLGKRDDIPFLLNISDLLIATSIREGFGINLVEALAAKLPVIAVDNRGHREIIKDGYNGYIVNNNIDELYEKFNLLYKDKALYNKLKDNSFESVSKFELKNSLDAMKKIYFS